MDLAHPKTPDSGFGRAIIRQMNQPRKQRRFSRFKIFDCRVQREVSFFAASLNRRGRSILRVAERQDGAEDEYPEPNAILPQAAAKLAAYHEFKRLAAKNRESHTRRTKSDRKKKSGAHHSHDKMYPEKQFCRRLRQNWRRTMNSRDWPRKTAEVTKGIFFATFAFCRGSSADAASVAYAPGSVNIQ